MMDEMANHGARTLAGNSLDWRYINVRRTMIMLEESIRLFEEGVGLIRRCRQVLGEAELKIQHLQAAGPDLLVGQAQAVGAGRAG